MKSLCNEIPENCESIEHKSVGQNEELQNEGSKGSFEVPSPWVLKKHHIVPSDLLWPDCNNNSQEYSYSEPKKSTSKDYSCKKADISRTENSSIISEETISLIKLGMIIDEDIDDEVIYVGCNERFTSYVQENKIHEQPTEQLVAIQIKSEPEEFTSKPVAEYMTYPIPLKSEPIDDEYFEFANMRQRNHSTLLGVDRDVNLAYSMYQKWKEYQNQKDLKYSVHQPIEIPSTMIDELEEQSPKSINGFSPAGQEFEIKISKCCRELCKDSMEISTWNLAIWANTPRTLRLIRLGEYIPESIDQTVEDKIKTIISNELIKLEDWSKKPNIFLGHDLRFIENEHWLMELDQKIKFYFEKPGKIVHSLKILYKSDISCVNLFRSPSALKSMKVFFGKFPRLRVSLGLKKLFSKFEEIFFKLGRGKLTDQTINRRIHELDRKGNYINFEWIFLRGPYNICSPRSSQFRIPYKIDENSNMITTDKLGSNVHPKENSTKNPNPPNLPLFSSEKEDIFVWNGSHFVPRGENGFNHSVNSPFQEKISQNYIPPDHTQPNYQPSNFNNIPQDFNSCPEVEHFFQDSDNWLKEEVPVNPEIQDRGLHVDVATGRNLTEGWQSAWNPTPLSYYDSGVVHPQDSRNQLFQLHTGDLKWDHDNSNSSSPRLVICESPVEDFINL